MNNSLDIALEKYKPLLKDYIYISNEELPNVKCKSLIKAIDKNTFELDYGGVVSCLKYRESFIQFYDIKTRRYRNFYINNKYLFYKPKVKINNSFRTRLERIIKSIDNE